MTGIPAVPANAKEAKYWNSAATRPWTTQHEAIDRLFREITRAAIDAADVRPGERVVDVGCGSGTTVLELAALTGPAGHVLGIDISQPAVAEATRRIAAARVRNAEVRVADASSEPFAREFHLMFSRFGVMFFGDPATTFVNLRKALKPEGRLALAVWRTGAENGWATAAQKALAHLLAPAPPADAEAPGPFSWADPARVRRILEGAGFRDVSLTPRDFALTLAPRGGAASAADFASQVGPIIRSLVDASDEVRRTIRAGLEEFFAGIEGPEGIVLPGAIWIVKARA
jgi:SAM-dependent methyltransferase